MPTNFNNHWKVLFNPGKTTHFFNIHYPEMQLNVQSYSKINALWLAELSHLIYRKESDETGKPLEGPTRNEILKSVNLQETRFWNNDGTQCAIVESQNEFAVLVFRGSYGFRDWLSNLKTLPVKWLPHGNVHLGFKEALEAVWDKIEAYLSTLQIPIFYTGHSLGAALATLAASKKPPHALYTFGSPRVGDSKFVESFRHIKAYRIVNNRDMVTTVPPSYGLNFCHVGELHYITHDNRMLVNPTEEMVTEDRNKQDPSLLNTTDYWEWFDPPELLTDHNPINYVAHLERLLR